MKIFITCFFVMITTNCLSDTLKLHFIGDFFKYEKYKIYYNGIEYTKKAKFGTDAFAINIIISDSIKNGEKIDVSVYRKGHFQFKYRNTMCALFYDDKKKYAVYLRDLKLKNRYSFNVFWTNETFIKNMLFWENGPIPKWADVDRIKVVSKLYY